MIHNWQTYIEAFMNRFLGKRYLPVWLILVIDLSMVAGAFFFSFLLLTDFDLNTLFTLNRLQALFFLELCYAISFVAFRSYEGAFRHTGTRDLMRLFTSTVVAMTASYAFSRFLIWNLDYDLKVLSPAFLILHAFTFSMGVLGLRLFVKLAYSRFVLNASKRKEIGVVVYGAGITGVAVRNALKQDPSSRMEVRAFIDDNGKLRGKRIDGIKVYSFDDVFKEEFLKQHEIGAVIWSPQEISGDGFKNAGEACITFGLRFERTPNIKDWIGGNLSQKQLRKVKIEDLLNRRPISLENQEVENFLKGKRVLVTGAAGSIGSEICRQVLSYGPEKLIMVDNGETPMYEVLNELARSGADMSRIVSYMCDVTREYRVNEIFKKEKPEVIFHAAAYKHVPLMEENPKEAVRVNVMGTKIVAEASISVGAEKFVMVSTDKAVNPSNVMGATKRTAEILVQSLRGKGKTEFVITRFGNVLGSNGSVIPVFRKQIENRENITVTHRDIVRYFMTIPEAVQLVLEAGTMGNGGEIFVFDMGDPVRIYDLAVKMVKLSGLELGKDIEIVFSGLRPGEKLYEELLNDAESTLPTHHPKIMKAKVREYDGVLVSALVERMSGAALNGSTDMDLVRLLKELVPEYVSMNSEFQKLDS
jgi:FlaA1/EpsC-like NDP-sugar epimerase